ncbi:MAG TPA: hypothetical protein VMD48_12120 [Solirubrobacteraceae bacterium]|nr:hypothetical protein [Solirubrobacteraceae bacterium]
MARKKAKEKLEEVADQTGYPEAKEYLQRLIADSDLRDSLNRAVDASRRASDRVGKARKPGKLLDDKKLQSDIQEALDAFRSAATGIAEAPGKAAKKGRRKGRKLFILVLGGGLALVGSEGLRSKVLDTLFGAEEEFEYAPPPPPPAPSPAAVPPKPADPEPAPTESSDAETTVIDSEDSPPDGAA